MMSERENSSISRRKVNFAAFSSSMRHLKKILTVLAVLLLLLPGRSHAQIQSEKELKKVADKYFEGGKYKDALPLYSQLVANYPKDANYNYRYGACLTFADEDKSKGLSYLTYAVTRPDVEPQSYFFLGKAYHLNYDFKRAANNYKKFMGLSKPKEQKKYEVVGHLTQAENGQSLLRNIMDIIVLEKQKLRESDFFKVYDVDEFGGRILVKPDEFRTEYEKKEEIESVMYLQKDAQTIYFTSIQGEEGSGQDLYYATKTDKGWSKPKQVPGLNTDLDEGFPFIHPNGRTLYFSSKGHNSLGGYDIFKSTMDSMTGRWGEPVNMDFAINTPDDDFLFITDQDEKTAYFSSKRSSKQGDVHVYKINMERVPLDVAVITGIFESKSTKKAKIDVKDVERGVQIGSWETDGQSGKYLIELPQTGKFQFLVDYEGSQVTHSGIVELKDQDPFSPLFQEMKIEHQGTPDEKLIIKNMIDIEISEDDPVVADIFKKRAQLNVSPPEKIKKAAESKSIAQGPKLEIVNEGSPETSGGAETAEAGGQEAPAGPSTAPRSKGEVPLGSVSAAGKLKFELSGEEVSKDEIVQVSFNNAKSLEKDAQILEMESEVAKGIATKRRQQSRLKAKEAANLLSSIDTAITSPSNLKTIDRVTRLKRQVELLEDEARTAEELAEKLSDRAYQKRSGVAIATSYANQIENSIDDGNTESSLAKLKELQDYVEEQKQEKSSINYSEEEIERKLKQKQTEYKNQRTYAYRLKDELFTKEKQLLEAKAGSKDAETLSKEIEQDRQQAKAADQRATATGREVETLAREVDVIANIIEEVQSSQPIRALATETPDETIIPAAVDVTEVLAEVAQDETLESFQDEAAEEPETTEKGLEIVQQTNVSSETATEVRAEGSSGREHNYAHTDYQAPSGSRFNPDHLVEQLTNVEDQTMIKVMRSGYNNAYQNDFMHVAEEPDELTRAMKMKVLNEDWLADMDREIRYLDSIDLQDPSLHAAIEERKSSIYRLRQIKEAELAKNESLVQRLASEQNADLAALEEEVRESYTPGPVPYVVGATEETAQAQSRPAAQSGPSQSTQSGAEAGTRDTGAQLAEASDGGTEGESIQPSADQSEGQDSESSSADESAAGEPTVAEDGQGTGDTQSGVEAGTQRQPEMASLSALERPQTQAGQRSSSAPRAAQVEFGSLEAVEQANISPTNSIFGEGSQFEPESPAGQLIPETQSKSTIEGVSMDVKNKLTNKKGVAEGELSSLEAELEDLNTQIASIKKKKKKRVIQAQIDVVAAKVEEQRRIVNAYVEQIGALDELTTVDAQSFSNDQAQLSPAEMASIQAQDLEKMAADTAQYAEDLRTLASKTKKKKERKRLIAKADVLTEKANRLTKQAEVANIQAEELKLVEASVVDVRNKVRLEIPKGAEVLSLADAQAVASSPEYQRFSNRVALGERKIAQAQVLYSGVKALESEAQMLDTEATEMENLANEQSDPEQKKVMMAKVVDIRKKAEEKRAQAETQRQEAEKLANEGNTERNAAIAEVMAADDQIRSGILSYVTQETTPPALAQQQPTSFSKDDFSKIVRGEMQIPKVLTSAIYQKIDFSESLYGDDNPIPVNTPLPEGVCYAVQVGAFLKPISQDVFRGFAPVRGEDGPNGFTRYSAGIFKKINEANLAKNEIRALGYSDAFVVAYRNGGRIPVFEARKILEDEAAVAAATPVGPQPSGASSQGAADIPADARLYSGEDVQGLYYTVQVGAYSKEVPPSAMFNLSPLVSHRVGGLVKYTSGIYNNKADASAAKTRIRDIGISDAFVTIYYKGERVSQSEADQLVQEQGDQVFANEQGLQNRAPQATQTSPSAQSEPPSSGRPAPASTGLIEFVVQVGAYEREVPVRDAQIILGISNLGLDVVVEGNMTKYIVGGYKSYQEANQFRESIIQQGLTGAFIVAMQNGKQVDLQRAIQLSGN
jgi:hypothetical protein